MLYIDGKYESSNESLDVISPTTGEVLGTVAKGREYEVNLAIVAAKNAFPFWSKLTVKDRYEYLNRVAEILRSKSKDIAVLITKEMGKPIKESEAEIALAIDYLEW